MMTTAAMRECRISSRCAVAWAAASPPKVRVHAAGQSQSSIESAFEVRGKRREIAALDIAGHLSQTQRRLMIDHVATGGELHGCKLT